MNKAQKEILAQRIQDENEVLEELKEMYGEALDQVDEYIKNLIESNKDDELLSKIYQQHYQEALKKQIEDIIQKLEDNQYQTVNDYIHDCYDNGYVGVMYDLQYQGIPITTPINQNMVVKAIENDTKLSKSLYQSLDMSKLKKDIRSELSRGIVTSSGYDVIATNISLRSKINLSNASRIARTEGHRVQNQAALDAMTDAKDEGADIVKQWDSTLDGNTRESHKILDGQIRETDDYFEVNGHRSKIPGGFGVPGEDINCRCAVLQRAKWALGADELKRLEERAKYFGLDKAKDFSDFRDKYIDFTYNEDRRKQVITNTDEIVSKDVFGDVNKYKSRFSQLGEVNELSNKIGIKSLQILNHRSGTKFEDLTYISSLPSEDGIFYSLTNRKQNKVGTVNPTKEMKDFVLVSPKNTIISIHNHPNSSVPSLSDLLSAKNYKYGIVIGHNGKIFKYSVNPDITNEDLIDVDFLLEFINRYLYDKSGKDMTSNINDKIEEMKKKGVEFEILN